MYKKIIIIILFLTTSSFSEEEYFSTLRNEITNLRQGPSFEYPIKILYKKNIFLF
jgi:hypothetical protein